MHFVPAGSPFLSATMIKHTLILSNAYLYHIFKDLLYSLVSRNCVHTDKTYDGTANSYGQNLGWCSPPSILVCAPDAK